MSLLEAEPSLQVLQSDQLQPEVVVDPAAQLRAELEAKLGQLTEEVIAPMWLRTYRGPASCKELVDEHVIVECTPLDASKSERIRVVEDQGFSEAVVRAARIAANQRWITRGGVIVDLCS